MQDTSNDANYTALLAAGAPKEYRAFIYQSRNRFIVYEDTEIVSASIRAAMLDRDLSVGNCIAKELQLVLYQNPGLFTIPRMAKIELQIRLNDGDVQSNWYPKGTFYIDTRSEDTHGRLVINAYDAMLMLDTPFCTDGEQEEGWPFDDDYIVEEILDRIQIAADPSISEVITNKYKVQYPGFGVGAMTMREVLGYIGALYAGNWVITDDNKMRIIVLGSIPALGDGYLINESGDYIIVGGYKIIVG